MMDLSEVWIFVFISLSVIKVSQCQRAPSSTVLHTMPPHLLEGHPTEPPSKQHGTKYQLFTRPSVSTKMRSRRTTPLRVSFAENCDYLAHYCLRAYLTGKVCARTLYYYYHTFKNYCLMDYVNCMERYDVWQVVHMGECFNVTDATEYLKYPYDDDYFLDQYYVLEDH